MVTFLFEYDNPLVPGKYLLGSPRWTKPVGLINCRLVCTAGASTDPTVLQLEIDGELIEKTIPIFPRFAGDRINLVIRIGLVLDANSELRVKCISGPTDPDDAIRTVGLNLSADDATTLSPVLPDGEMFVRWVTDTENLRIFDYDTATHLFTESVAGISSSRADLDNAVTFQAKIQDVVVAQSNSSQQFSCEEIVCNGGLATSETPRLEFFIGPTRAAVLTASGRFFVADVTESASISSSDNTFDIYGNGELAAVIGRLTSSGPNILSTIESHEPAA